MQTIFVDKTSICAFKKMIKSIDENENNIIIVPDKFSLSSEQLFFEENNLTVSFSTQTFSLTKLATKILKKRLVDKKVIDKNISIMIISSVINENLGNFKYFVNIQNINEFSADVFNFLSQVQSSGLTQFNAVSGSLKNKIDDINLIIKEYEKKRAEYLIDSGYKFDLFLDEIKNSDLIKNTNFYFGMFNNLTNQVKKIIKEIAKYAKSVKFSASFVENRVNNNEIFEFYRSLDSKSVVIKSNSMDEFNNFVVDKFFGTSDERKEITNDRLLLFEAKNIEEEIDNVIYEIKKDVFLNKFRFCDIAVCVSDLNKYSGIIKEKFAKFGFNFFVDESAKLSSFGYPRFVIELLKCVQNFDVQLFLNLIKSGYIFGEKEKFDNFENFVRKTQIKNFSEKEKVKCFDFDECFQDYVFVLENYVAKILEFRNNYENWSVIEFFNNLNLLLDQLGAPKKLEEKIEQLKQSDVLLFKQFCQLEDKIQACFDNVCEFYKEKLDIKKLIYFVSVCFENTMVSLPPVSVDAIFVGDSVNSYFKNYKNVYCLGLDMTCPKATQDDSIFLESELELIEKDVEINPKPSLVNKINFFKCFENLLCSTQKLVLSYHVAGQNGQNYPSIFLKNFLRYFSVDKKPITLFKITNEILNQFDENQILALLALKLSDKDEFVKNYYLQEDGKLKDVLEKIVRDKTDWKNENQTCEIDKNLLNITTFSSTA
ncbi:MAG: PD-(D/E)XK nuclease family protein, partial [Christensenellales bacterium]